MKTGHAGWSMKEVETTSQDKNYVKAQSDSKSTCDRDNRYPAIDPLPVSGSGT
jgi:hypothetical protein